MSVGESPDVVRRSILVRCHVDVAFRVWTEQIDLWWPKGHTRSGDRGTTVMLEGRVGGRLYERTSDAVEHSWGEVLIWDPPRHLAYHWYLGSGPERPTRVDVVFSATAEGHTRVEVTHRGPELIGELWARTSSRFAAAWDEVLAAYAARALQQQEGAG